MRIIVNNKGSIFITVTVVLSIMLIMLGLLLAITATDVRISQSYSNGIKAYYLAESGAAKAIAYSLKSKPKDPVSETLTQDDNIFPYSKNYSITWSVVYDNNTKIYTINSQSTYERAVRKLQVLITITQSDTITITEWKLIN